MSIELSLWIGAAACVFAVLLSSTRIALINLSGGMIRRLEDKNKKLADTLESWIECREDLRLLLRLLLALDLFLIFYCLSSWENHCLANNTDYLIRFAPPVIGLLIFVLLTEFVGLFMSTHNTARYLARTIPLVWLLGFLIFPLYLPVKFIRRRLLFWWQNQNQETETATAEDEIMSLVEHEDEEEDNGQASLEADERRMIKGVFDLDETLVREIMTPRVDVQAVPDDAGLDAVRAKIVQSGHSRIPVYRESIDEIVGVIYAKDLLDDSRGKVHELSGLYHKPVFIPETKNVGDLLAEFQQSRNHFSVVLDEYGGTSGVVTFEDILEEIVGDIRDEYDHHEQSLDQEMQTDGSMIVDARTPICEINELMDMELPEDEDFDTMGGFISALAGHIPETGEKLEADGCSIEVLEADMRRVLRVRIHKRQDPDSGLGES